MEKRKILNIQFDVVTKDEAVARIFEILAGEKAARHSERGRYIVTPNPEMLLEAQRNPLFAKALNEAWMSIPDGSGILWASTLQSIARKNGTLLRFFKGITTLSSLLFFPKYCRRIFPDRITGVDLMEAICAARPKESIFLLGAKPGVAERVQNFLEKKYRGITIAGTFSGTPSDDDFLRIQSLIAEMRPEILFVAYGSPAQELWIRHHLHKLPSVKIAMGVGGAFDFLSGTKQRAPTWMRRAGLEWLWRLKQEPTRAKRIWNAVIVFPWTIMKKPTSSSSRSPSPPKQPR